MVANKCEQAISRLLRELREAARISYYIAAGIDKVNLCSGRDDLNGMQVPTLTTAPSLVLFNAQCLSIGLIYILTCMSGQYAPHVMHCTPVQLFDAYTYLYAYQSFMNACKRLYTCTWRSRGLMRMCDHFNWLEAACMNECIILQLMCPNRTDNSVTGLHKARHC